MSALLVNEKQLWSAPRIWDGLECFVVCGGESVRQHDLGRLAGRKVIVVNSSYQALLNADFLVFGDKRWWEKHRKAVRETFRGEVVTVTPMRPHLEYQLMGRRRHGGFALTEKYLLLTHTTTTAAINLAAHLGARVINMLGLDGKGEWHHAPHPWRQNQDKFRFHAQSVKEMMVPLYERRIQLYTCNTPEFAPLYSFIPHRPFDDMVRDERQAEMELAS